MNLSPPFRVDDGSTDGSTDEIGGANVIRVEQPVIDQNLRCRDVSFFFNSVLKRYDAAIYVDVDEFMVADPLLHMGHADYIQRSPLDHLNAIGLNVIHNPAHEPAYSDALGIFEQRSYVCFQRDYCKQLIHKQRVFWGVGFHVSTEPVAMAEGLYLFHLRAFDVETSIARTTGRNKLAWSDASLAQNLGWQNRLAAEDYLRVFYIHDQSRWAAVAPAVAFDRYVAERVNYVREHPDQFAGTIQTMEWQPAAIPPRFRHAIPAVEPVAQIQQRNREQFGPPGPRLDAVELYRRAIARAERAQR